MSSSEILYAKVYGTAPESILIVHGLFGMSDNWNTIAQKLSEYYTVHCLDLRNHGRSFHSDSMNFQVMANDISEYVKINHLTDFSLLGHSLGGKVVMEYALTYPNSSLKKLMVADMSPKPYPPHHQGIIKALQSVDFQTVQSRKEVEEILKKYIQEVGVIQFLMKNLYWDENKKLGFRFNVDAISKNYNEIINKPNTVGIFEKPTLFLAGEKSNYIAMEDSILIKTYFPNARIEKVSQAGHWLHADNPTEFTDKVLDFMRQPNN